MNEQKPEDLPEEGLDSLLQSWSDQHRPSNEKLEELRAQIRQKFQEQNRRQNVSGDGSQG